MSQQGLEEYGAYRKSQELFALVVDDMDQLRNNPLCWKLVSQQVGCCDSIAANIEEGYGRLSPNEFIRFLDFSRASARETRGRYVRMSKWLSEDVVNHRIALIDEIIGIETSTIKTLRTRKEGYVNEGIEPYDDILIEGYNYDN